VLLPLKKFPFFLQRDAMDCGPTCLKMVTQYFGRNYTIQSLRRLCAINSEGVSMLDISEAAEQLGLRTLGVKLKAAQLKTADLPCIVHWRQNHFTVLYKLKGGKYYIADPAAGLLKIEENTFNNSWLVDGNADEGNVLFIQPTPLFYQQNGENEIKLNWSFITGYLTTYRQLLFQLVLALATGTLIQLAAPFLTQSIVDVGISNHNLNFINVILIAQLMLFAGSTSVEFLRSWILLHISTRVNISILTDFLIKLMKLPMSFFDTKTAGDIMQRISDEKRIESFLTGSTLSTVFSVFNFIVFSVIIAFYNTLVFAVFAAATILYVTWIAVFLKRRKELDYKQFSNNLKNQDNILEIVNGMKEIKLNNAETGRRWKWEHTQAALFNFNIKSLALSQYQQAGAVFINQGKNILITWLSAKAVINGDFSLGAMMAIQYIVGQLNGPVEQLIGFTKAYQDARISVERLNEIYAIEDEEPAGREYVDQLGANMGINIDKITFRYPGAGNEPVLHDITLHIPPGKTTAVVGTSGSGKTTLLKLLLRYYEPEAGEIYVGDDQLKNLKFSTWRSKCSAVMQDGYIFADTIAGNIAMDENVYDAEKLNAAVRIANAGDIIDNMPYGINSKIGIGGQGLSQGQTQRILIARAVYKDPEFVFFDEATNALDANNEKAIIENLQDFLAGKTVIVVAHRLSTVKNANNIVVLEKGHIVEQGTHASLVNARGTYYNLIKNQLELGT
jgi:ATP-binding cassette subfamily B protein